MSAEVDAQKLEMLRLALPKGLSAGDTGLVESRGMPDVMNGFSPFRTNITQSSQYSNTPPISIDAPISQTARPEQSFHPWKVSLRKKPNTDPPQYEYKIELNSVLYSGIGSFEETIAITGLDFWSDASDGYLYLFGVVEDGVCTEASIQGPEAIPSDRIDFIDAEQNSFSAIIGYLYQDADGVYQVTQHAFENFTLMDTCVNGKSAIYPMAI